jgi:hypothetical protein
MQELIQLEIVSTFTLPNVDGLAKNCNSATFVIPANAGIKLFQNLLDPGVRRGDDPIGFFLCHQF